MQVNPEKKKTDIKQNKNGTLPDILAVFQTALQQDAKQWVSSNLFHYMWY